MKPNHNSEKNQFLSRRAPELSEAAINAEFENAFRTPPKMPAEDAVIDLMARLEETKRELHSLFNQFGNADVAQDNKLDKFHSHLTSELRQLQLRLMGYKNQNEGRN